MSDGLSVIWGGDYSPTKTYYKNQAVFHEGSSYRANKTTTEEPSPEALDWDLLASGSDSGEPVDLSDYYTKTQTDTLLNNKANQSTTYNKTEVDNLIIDNLVELDDVAISSPSDGQALVYDSSISKWTNETISTGGGGGEVNTASNVGTAGVGIYKQKTGVNLEFKKLNAGSNKITITDDTSNSEVDINVSESNLTLDNLGGTLSISKGGTGSTSASAALSALGGASSSSLSSHTGNTSNPHSVTASQVGNTTSQWNANKLQGTDIISTAPTNGQVLVYNSATSKWEPTTLSTSGKLIQTVYAESNTITTIAAGGFTNIGLSITITPINTSNFLYFYVVIHGIEKVSGTADTTYMLGAQIYNTTASTSVYSTGASYSGRFTTQYMPPYYIQAKSSITSTASTTYNVRVAAQSGSIRFQSNNALSNIIVTEVSP
ncbi:hypothetical protein [Nostoc sp. 2RC]|uniref:hypothetical protein n=1 Tax=Nostoc sp. 2RC TaxID=2485484 RepID=UPI001625F08A|nr:hypothetical protein [Nostoc sp. 2RC]MBC1235911.1 hypothetical protein [Nostoc sp. 2RC]